MVELVNEDPKGPDVSFGPIYIVNESLWAHVEGTTDSDISESMLSLDGKAKISQFEIAVLNEDIGHFNIPVNDS